MKQLIKNKKILLLLLILIQTIYLTVSFAINKQGYHSDEIWNYGFANSTDEKNIYYCNPEENEYKYIYEWTDSKVLYEYITVDKSEIFAYDAIYRNLKKDLNPPLQFMILHFICSLFLGRWSKWFGYSINIFSFVLIQLYLFKLIKRVTKNDFAAYMGVMAFGFSVGATSITTFLRMYALGVAFAVMFIYYANEVYSNRDNKDECRKNIIKTAVVLLLGSLTIHQFLILAFFVVLLYSLYYLFTGKIKLLFSFGLSMLASVGISILLFPSTFTHLFGYTENSIIKKYPTLWQFRIYLSFVTKDISGYHISAIRTMTLPYCFVGIVVITFILVPICFLMRKEEKFKRLVAKIINRCRYGIKNIKKIPFTVVVLILSVLLFVMIDARNTSIFRMGIYSKRYVFIVYPLYGAAVCALTYYIIRLIFDKRIIGKIVFFIFCLSMIATTYVFSANPFYLKHYEDGVTLKDLEKDADFIAVMSEDWVLVSGASELYDTHSYFLTDYLTYDKMNYEREDSSHPLYLVLDITGIYEGDPSGDCLIDISESETVSFFGSNIVSRSDIMDFYSNADFSTKMEYVGIDELYGRVVEIYRLN